ncbi:hypothetical protein SC81_22280, partial [Vibrio vulnificus]
HGERDVLMLTVWHGIKLSGYPLFGGFGATRAASLRLAALTDYFCMWTVWSAAVVVFSAHHIATARQHSFYASDLPETEGLGVLPKYLFPSVVLFKKKLRGSRDKFFWGMTASATGVLNHANR